MIDLAVIKVKAGNGGDGKVSFRREKFIPKGGPDGGDGGNGGSVYFVADHNMATLRDFRTKPIFKALNGASGGGRKMSGAGSEDLYVKVPVGTLVYNVSNGKETLLGDMIEGGQTLLIAQGGTGGKGNDRFKSSTNRTPIQYTEGTKGEVKEIKLEIKVLADVGLVGLPNVGKSTLINKLTKSNVKTANYPFTTLTPNLGVYTFEDGQDIVIADIPGLIEGASEGKGLGHDFLRHIERTRLLIHIIDPYSFELDEKGGKDKSGILASILNAYKTIRGEMEKYSDVLAKKPEIVAINKLDMEVVKEAFPDIKNAFARKKIKVFGISAITGEGVKDLLNEMRKGLSEIPATVIFEPQQVVKTYTIENLPNRRMVYNNKVSEGTVPRNRSRG